MATATTTPPADKDEQAKAEAAAKAAADKAATDAAARIAELEAEVVALREQADAAATKAADPGLPDSYVYVVDAAGSPIPANPYVPKSWLDKENAHLLPEGAKKATKEQEGAIKAALAARRPRP
jgi:hypothetical protein